MFTTRFTALIASGVLLGSLVVGPSLPAGAAPVPSWHNPVSLPGVPANSSMADQAACSAAGNCVVISNWPTTTPVRVYASTELRGKWGQAQIIGAGLKGFVVTAISCPNIRNCVVTGSYETSTAINGVIISESNGRWGRPLPIITPPDVDGFTSSPGQMVYCWSAGNCVAGGGSGLAWVTVETQGAWGSVVPFGSATNPFQPGVAEDISCTGPGQCTVAGIDMAGGGVFVVTLSNGQWSSPVQLAEPASTIGTANGGQGAVNSISCASLGNCVLGGNYPIIHGSMYHEIPYLATEVNGVWGPATAVARAETANTSGVGTTSYVRCWSGGVCVALGFYSRPGPMLTWESVLRGGHWTTALNLSASRAGVPFGALGTEACTSPADCVGTGWDMLPGASTTDYTIDNGHFGANPGLAVEVSEWNGKWQYGRWLYPYFSWVQAMTNAVTCSPTGTYCLMVGARVTGASYNPLARQDIVSVYS